MGCFRQTRVKAIAQQDESIGKMAAEATSLIGELINDGVMYWSFFVFHRHYF